MVPGDSLDSGLALGETKARTEAQIGPDNLERRDPNIRSTFFR
jgi:hypothetical protein